MAIKRIIIFFMLILTVYPTELIMVRNTASDNLLITANNLTDETIQPIPASDSRTWIKSPYRNMIRATALKYDLDPQIIYATIMTESEGNPFSYRYESHLNDASLGLGQILISTARSLGFSGHPYELYKPEISIDLIGKYHRNMLDHYGQLTPIQLATAYNAGSPWKRPVYGHISRFNKWYFEEA